jgi:hypothetical protein
VIHEAGSQRHLGPDDRQIDVVFTREQRKCAEVEDVDVRPLPRAAVAWRDGNVSAVEFEPPGESVLACARTDDEDVHQVPIGL